MAISSQRFKFLDKETNLPVKEFLKLTDNAVYNTVSDVVNSTIQGIKSAEAFLKNIVKSIKNLANMIMKNVKGVIDAIKAQVKKIVDLIAKIKGIPKYVQDIFAKLKETSEEGVKEFVQDVLKVGEAFLCHNLDFLKMFMTGYALNKNVIGGLLTGLMFGWMDRICKGYSKEEQRTASKIKQLEMVVMPTGIELTPSNTFMNFTNTYADYVRANKPIERTAPLPVKDFLTNITQTSTHNPDGSYTLTTLNTDGTTNSSKAVLNEDGTYTLYTTNPDGSVTTTILTSSPIKDISSEIEYALNNLRTSEITSAQKKAYEDAITLLLTILDPNSSTYRVLLGVRGKLATLPLVHPDRRNRNVSYSNISDLVGGLSINIVEVDLSQTNRNLLSDIEKSLFDKVLEFQEAAKNSPEVKTRTHNSGSFSNFNFDEIMPTLSSKEKAYIESLPGTNSAHRVHDMHPTSLVFLGC